MAKIYLHKWTTSNGESFDDLPEEAKRDWIFVTRDMQPDDWNRALEKCKRLVREGVKTGASVWPPSYIEFAAYAEPEAPDREICFVELQKYLASPEHRRQVTDLSPFAYHTYTQNLDSYNFKQMSPEEARRSFNAAYKLTMFQYENGQKICEPKTMIEHKPIKPNITKKDKAVGARTIESLKALF